MPFAVACPRCRAIIVLEALGAFDCPHCTPNVETVAPSESPKLAITATGIALPLPPPPAIILELPEPEPAPAPPPGAREVDWKGDSPVLPKTPVVAGIPLSPSSSGPPRARPVVRARANPPTQPTEEELEDEYDDEYDEAHLVQQRAFRERERVARRKLLTKLGIVITLAIAVAIVVPLAIAHVRSVADHNAEIKAHR